METFTADLYFSSSFLSETINSSFSSNSLSNSSINSSLWRTSSILPARAICKSLSVAIFFSFIDTFIQSK
ncbi:hypothetical protein ACF0H5_001365 [Mactra antiquata]